MIFGGAGGTVYGFIWHLEGVLDLYKECIRFQDRGLNC